MNKRVLILALAGLATPGVASANDDFCSQLFIQAVSQICQLLPNGLNLCQPIGLVGPAPECKDPARQGLQQVALAPPSVQSPLVSQFAAETAARPASPFGYRPLPAPSAPVPPSVQSPQVTPFAAETAARPASPFGYQPLPAPSAPVPPSVQSPQITPFAAETAARPASPFGYRPLPAPSAPVAVPAPVATPAPVAAPAPVATPAPVAAPAPVATPAPVAFPAPVATPAPIAAPAPVATPAPLIVPPAQVATPPAAPAAAATPVIQPEDHDALAHFDFDSAVLTPAGQTALDTWVAQAPRGKPVRVTGHADRLGPEPYNLKLSLRRAESVKQYLAGKGVSARVIQLEARGESVPVKRCQGDANPATKACLAPNRRAEVAPE